MGPPTRCHRRRAFVLVMSGFGAFTPRVISADHYIGVGLAMAMPGHTFTSRGMRRYASFTSDCHLFGNGLAEAARQRVSGSGQNLRLSGRVELNLSVFGRFC